MWEKEPLEHLAKDGQLSAYIHRGFWCPMDTLRDRNYLETLWSSGNAPWKPNNLKQTSHCSTPNECTADV